MPTSRKATSATTLISANQNSISPKTLTDTRFSASTTDQRGQGPDPLRHRVDERRVLPKKFMYSATAVTSTMAVIAQFSQYSQPATNAAFSPKNSRA